MLLRIVFVSVWLWLVTFGIACSNGERKEEHMEKKGKIAMIIAPNDFRDEEYLVPKRIFEEAGYEVTTSPKTTTTPTNTPKTKTILNSIFTSS